MSNRLSRTKVIKGVLALGLAVGVLAGCQTESVPTRGRQPAAPVQSQDEQCATNMHDLAGYLLQYYLTHRQLPDQLAQLSSVVDFDQELPQVCPASKQAYLYFPDGLVAAGDKRQVILMDPVPAHNGKRFAIITYPPEGKTPLGLWVVQLSEFTAQQFHQP